MEDGQLNSLHVGAIIQARMDSTRLPGKTLLPIPFESGKPLLQWVVDPLKLSKRINKIVLATSTSPSNDPLISFADHLEIDVFRGDENDVLSRFAAVIIEHKFDHVVRITGDNPLIDISLLDQLICEHINEDMDYTTSEGLPVGMNMEIIKAASLLKLVREFSLTDADREHVTFSLRRSKTHKTSFHSFQNNLKTVRVTIDYPADFAALSLILAVSIKTEKNGMELIEYVNENMPWIWSINESQVQKTIFESEMDELEQAAQMLERVEMKFASNLIRLKLASMQ
jgi:spore coat polysaccharide biosynthesis protein SpsF